MAIEKQTVVDQIEMLLNGNVQIREATIIIEDGEPISTKYTRRIIQPGEDYSQEPPRVQEICATAAKYAPPVAEADQTV